jgi:hypothetical protein
MSKILSLSCLFLAMSCLPLLTAEFTNAQNTSLTSFPTPSAPEFSVSITNSSYYVPITYSTDPFNGQKIANGSYYSGFVDALNLTIRIKNQPLALSTQSDLYNGFKYFIEIKNHSSTNWISLTGYVNGLGTVQDGLGFLPSQGSETSLSFQFSAPYFPVNNEKEYPANTSGLTYATTPFFPITVNKDEYIDLRVGAGIGNFQYISMGQLLFSGNYSDWNELTMPLINGETSNVNPSPSPTVPEFPVVAILPLFVIMLLAVLMVKSKTRFFG